MIGGIDRRSLSLLELYRRAKLAEQVRRGETSVADGDRRADASEILDRRDERGVRYPGDFPNDLTKLYRGCF